MPIHETEPRKSKRRNRKTSFGPDFVVAFLIEVHDRDELNYTFLSVHVLEDDPKTYDEVVRSLDAVFFFLEICN